MRNFRSCINNKRLLYEKYMQEVRGIYLTYREVDVISCVINNRGEKKIAYLLDISPRTVSTHVHNIMLKLKKNSRDGITDFIEESGKLNCIKDYYNCILVESLFNKILTKSQLNKGLESFSCCIENMRLDHTNNYIISSIRKHLLLTNICLKNDKVCTHRIFLLHNKPESYPKSDKDIFLLLNHNVDTENYSDIEYIDFTLDYYLAFFELLKKITKNKKLNDIIKTFVIRRDIILRKESPQNLDEEPKKAILNRTVFLQKAIFFIGVISTILFLYTGINILSLSKRKKHITSALKIAKQDVFLDRSATIKLLDTKFTNNNGIQSVLIFGPAGSGKTTIARQYAKNILTPVIWEIDAKTPNTITRSIKNLSYALATSEEDYEVLNEIYAIQQNTVQKRAIIKDFLSNKVKGYTNWMLIFNDVSSFDDISEYFPHNQSLWGNGKIIITSRNNYLINTNNIPIDDTIYVGKLTKQEKYDLFCKIAGDYCNHYCKNKRNLVLDLLDQIPPYPLDIITAGYYINNNQNDDKKYIECMNNQSKPFISLQKDIIKSTGLYSETRYDLLASSINKILNKSEFLSDVLLLIGLVDFHDIPRELLDEYKGNIIIDQFIINHRGLYIFYLSDKEREVILSFDSPMIQSMILYHLREKYNLTKHSKQLEEIIDAMDRYIYILVQTRDVKKIQKLIPHIKTFLSRTEWLNKNNKKKLLTILTKCNNAISTRSS